MLRTATINFHKENEPCTTTKVYSRQMPEKFIHGDTGKNTFLTIVPIKQGKNMAKHFIVQFSIFTIVKKKQKVKITFYPYSLFLIMSHQKWFNFLMLFYIKVAKYLLVQLICFHFNFILVGVYMETGQRRNTRLACLTNIMLLLSNCYN